MVCDEGLELITAVYGMCNHLLSGTNFPLLFCSRHDVAKLLQLRTKGAAQSIIIP